MKRLLLIALLLIGAAFAYREFTTDHEPRYIDLDTAGLNDLPGHW